MFEFLPGFLHFNFCNSQLGGQCILDNMVMGYFIAKRLNLAKGGKGDRPNSLFKAVTIGLAVLRWLIHMVLCHWTTFSIRIEFTTAEIRLSWYQIPPSSSTLPSCILSGSPATKTGLSGSTCYCGSISMTGMEKGEGRGSQDPVPSFQS